MSDAFEKWWQARDFTLAGTRDVAERAWEAGRLRGQSEAFSEVSLHCNAGLRPGCPDRARGEHYNECPVAAAVYDAENSLASRSPEKGE